MDSRRAQHSPAKFPAKELEIVSLQVSRNYGFTHLSRHQLVMAER